MMKHASRGQLAAELIIRSVEVSQVSPKLVPPIQDQRRWADRGETKASRYHRARNIHLLVCIWLNITCEGAER